ncbi:MAG TPA: TRAP transporter substrate-binding protein DctP [Syntrophorhabdaceae bacterium]|nr:TRAP transporter substrate-binding protein DctP [Syntrophorhabdaceae bacterium]
MKRIGNGILLLVAISLIITGFSGTAVAQQNKVIELTFGTPFPVDHMFSVTDKKWMDKVEKETNGRVKFKPYWGGAVIGGRDSAEQLVQGVVDIAFLNPTTSRSGFPITKASFLFMYGVKNLEVGEKVWKDLLTKFPEIEQDYKGMKVLCWAGNMNQLITRKPVRRTEELKGMRIQTYGDVTIALKDLGIEGLSMSGAEVYVALQKGILDGLFIPAEALDSLKLSEVAKYATMINFYRCRTGMRMMNLNKFNSLPPDIKKVIESNIDYYGKETETAFNQRDTYVMGLGGKLGVEFIRLSNEDLAKFYAPIKMVAAERAKELDSMGLPGTKILNEAQRLIQLYNK